MKPYPKVIVVRRDGQDGSEYPVTSGRCVFGSASDSDIRMRTPGTESKHCMIIVDSEKQAHLISVGGTAVLQVHGKPVHSEAPLAHGDIFEVQGRKFRFEWCKGSNPATPGRSPPAPRKGSLGQGAQTAEKKSRRSSMVSPLRGRIERKTSPVGNAPCQGVSPVGPHKNFYGSIPASRSVLRHDPGGAMFTPRSAVHARVAALREGGVGETSKRTPRRSRGAALLVSTEQAVGSPDRKKSAALMSIHGSRRWADVVAHGIAKKTPVRVEKRKFRTTQKRKKLRSLAVTGHGTPALHIGSTGHANSPATIVVGRCHVRKSTQTSSPSVSLYSTPTIPTEVFVSPLSTTEDDSETSQPPPEPAAGGSGLLRVSSGRKQAPPSSAKKGRALRGTPTADYRNVAGVRRTLRRSTPKANYTKVVGVKRMYQKRTPTADYTKVSGVKRIFQTCTPKADYGDVGGVKRMYQKGPPQADYTDTTGVKRMYQRGTPEADYTDATGVKRMYQKGTPKADYSDVSGVRRLGARSPRNSYSNLEGVQELVKTPLVDSKKQTNTRSSRSAKRSGKFVSSTVRAGGEELPKAAMPDSPPGMDSHQNMSPQKLRGRVALRKSASPNIAGKHKLTHSKVGSAKQPKENHELHLEGTEPAGTAAVAGCSSSPIRSPEKGEGTTSPTRRSVGLRKGTPKAGPSMTPSPRKSTGLKSEVTERSLSPSRSLRRSDVSASLTPRGTRARRTGTSPDITQLPKRAGSSASPVQKSAVHETKAAEVSTAAAVPLRESRESARTKVAHTETNPAGARSPKRARPSVPEDRENSPSLRNSRRGTISTRKKTGLEAEGTGQSPSSSPSPRRSQGSASPTRRGTRARRTGTTPSITQSPKRAGNSASPARKSAAHQTKAAEVSAAAAVSPRESRESTGIKAARTETSPAGARSPKRAKVSVPEDRDNSPSPRKSRRNTISTRKSAGLEADGTEQSPSPSRSPRRSQGSATPTRRGIRARRAGTNPAITQSPKRAGNSASPARKSAAHQTKAAEVGAAAAPRESRESTGIKAAHTETSPAGVRSQKRAKGSLPESRDNSLPHAGTLVARKASKTSPTRASPSAVRSTTKEVNVELAGNDSVEAPKRSTRGSRVASKVSSTKDIPKEIKPVTSGNKRTKTQIPAEDLTRKESANSETTEEENAPVRGRSRTKRTTNDAAKSEDVPSRALRGRRARGAGVKGNLPVESPGRPSMESEGAKDEDAALGTPHKRGTRGTTTSGFPAKTSKKHPVDIESAEGKYAPSGTLQKSGRNASKDASTQSAKRNPMKTGTAGDEDVNVETPTRRGKRGTKASKDVVAQSAEKSPSQLKTAKSEGISSGTPRRRGTRATRASPEKCPVEAESGQEKDAPGTPQKRTPRGAKATKVPPSKSPKRQPVDIERVKNEDAAALKKAAEASKGRSLKSAEGPNKDESATPKKRARVSARTTAAVSPISPVRSTSPKRATRAAKALKSESESLARTKTNPSSPRKRTRGSASASPQRSPVKKEDVPDEKRSRRGIETSPARAAAPGSPKKVPEQSSLAKPSRRAVRGGRTRPAQAAEDAIEPAAVIPDDVSEELGSVDPDVATGRPARRTTSKRGTKAAVTEEELTAQVSRRGATSTGGRRGAVVEGLVDMNQLRDLQVMLSPIQEFPEERVSAKTRRAVASSAATTGTTRRTRRGK